MTEYALKLAAIAVVVFVTYEVMGQDISTLSTVLTQTQPRLVNPGSSGNSVS